MSRLERQASSGLVTQVRSLRWAIVQAMQAYPPHRRVLYGALVRLERSAVKVCVVARSVESLLQTGGVQRKTSGSSDPPEGESRRGQQHVREAEDIGRRL